MVIKVVQVSNSGRSIEYSLSWMHDADIDRKLKFKERCHAKPRD